MKILSYLLLGLVAYSFSACTSSQNVSATPTASTINKNILNSPKMYSINDLADHNTKNNCWVAINNKVYDVTPFVSLHPGGEEKILKGCGVDGTELFKKFHMDKVLNTLEKYSLGVLK